MRKMLSVFFITMAALAMTVTLGTAAYADETPNPMQAPMQEPVELQETSAVEATEADGGSCAEPALAPSEPSSSAVPQGLEPVPGGQPCGGAICGKGEYCCNASCSRCVPFGMSCTQESCN